MKAMKKTVGILSLVIMLLSQIFTPLTYAATGDNEDNPVIPEVLNEQEAEIDEPENPVEIGDLSSGNNTGVDAVSGDVVIIPEIQANAEYSGDAENYSGSTEILSGDLNVFSGNINNLSGTEENLKEDEETSNGSGKEENTGIIENVKSFFGLGEDEEESKEIYGSSEYEGVKVEVYAATGLFASGTELTIQPITGPKIEEVKEVLSGEVNMVEEEQKQAVVAFDITFRDPVTKEELQPKNGTVQVTFNYEDNTTLKQTEENEEQEVKVYHLNDIDEKGDKIENITETIVEEAIINEEDSKEKGVMVIEADSFSVYALIVNIVETPTLQVWLGDEHTSNLNGNGGESFTFRDMVVSNGEESIILMDRNLGAGESGTGTSSYGYYYQRGNNHGFSTPVGSTSSSSVNASEYGPDKGNGYYDDSTFITQAEWDSSNNENLWGGTGDYYTMGGQTSQNPESGRQGPCPTGYHVPSQHEWNTLVKIWSDSYKGDDITNKNEGFENTNYTYKWIDVYGNAYKDFVNKFNIPLAGFLRIYDGNLVANGDQSVYLSSSPYFATSTSNNAFYFNIVEQPIGYKITSNYQGQRGMGASVRCFKNKTVAQEEHTVKLYSNESEEKELYLEVKVNDGENFSLDNYEDKFVQPGYVLNGWYYTVLGERVYVEFPLTITNDVDLYADWSCAEDYAGDGTECFISKKYIYNANGGVFEDGKSIKKVFMYNKQKKSIVTNNNGHLYEKYNNVIYFTGATSLNISGFVNVGNGDGKVYDYDKTKQNNGNTYSLSYGNNNIDIDSDVITIETNGSNGMSWRYENLRVTATYANNELMPIPTREGFTFLGWYNEGKHTWDDKVKGSNSDITLTAIWYNEENESTYHNKTATFMTGAYFNATIKSLAAGKSVSTETRDYSISNFVRVDSLPSNENLLLISSLESEVPIYAWYDNGTIYYHTLANKIYLNEISSRMFYMLNGITSLDLSIFDVSNVKSFGMLFNDSPNLETLNLDGWNLRNSSGISGIFSNTPGLKYISMSGRKIPTTFTCGLGQCWSAGSSPIEEIDVTNWDLSETTSISAIFANNTTLQRIKGLETWDTSNVKNMSNMFQSGSNLRELNLSHFNTENVTTMSNMFYGCSSLKSLDLSNFDTKNVTDMGAMFARCSSLESLVLDSWNLRKTTVIGGFLYNTNSLKTISMSGWKIPENFTHGLGRSWSAGSSPIEEIDVTNWNLSDTTNLQGILAGNSNLQRIKGLETWNTSNVENMSDMFDGDSNITRLDLSNFNTENVTTMANMFNGCSKVKTIFVSTTFDVSHVTNSDNMFYNASSLIGGNGTIYSGAHINKDYAVIDKQGSVGYFTDKNEATVVYYVDGEKYLENPGIPEKNGYHFLGWYEDGVKKLNANQTVDHYTELYPLFEKDGNTVNFETILLDGATFNTIIKKVSNNGIELNQNAVDKKIKKFVKAENIPNGADQRIVSTLESDTPVYVWFDNGTLYYYSKANKIYLNEDSMYMFNNLKKLQSLDLSNFSIEYVKGNGLSSIIKGDTLTELNLSGWNFSNYNASSLMMNLTNGGMSSLRKINLTNTVFSGSINYILGGMGGLNEIIFDGVDTLNVTEMGAMFNGCSSLTGLDLSNFKTQNVTSFGSMFYGASSLENLNLDGWDLRKAGGVGGAFNGATSLKYISMSGWKIPENFTHGLGRSWCAGSAPLEEIDVTNWDLSNTTNLQGLFADSKIQRIKGLESWNTSNVTNMESMFERCGYLSELDLSSFDMSSVTNTINMFNSTANLKKIYVSGNFDNTSFKNNSSFMFDQATNIKGGNGTTYNYLKVNGDYARIDEEGNPGYFTNILDKPYTITYELNNGTGENRTGYTSRDDTFTLNNPTREGYTFLGWTGSNLTEPTVDVEIVKGTKGNLHFTANWKLIENTVVSTSSSSGKGRVLPSKQKATTEEQEHNAADEKAETETESNNESENNQENDSLSQSVTVKQQVRKIASKTLTRGEVAVMTNVLIDVFPQLLTDRQEIKDNNECISFADEASFTNSEKKAITRLCKLSIMGIHAETKKPLDEFLVKQLAKNNEFATVINRSISSYNEKDLTVVKDALKKLENNEDAVEFGTLYNVFMSVKNLLN